MYKKQKIVSKNDIEEEHAKIKYVVEILNQLGNRVKIIPTKYFTYKQFLDINQGWLHIEHDDQSIPLGYLTPTNYAYIYVPATDDPDPTTYSFALLHIFKGLRAANPIGWIFDFRGNSGGVIHSFLLGFLPILDEFVINAIDKNKEKKMELIYDRESIFFKYTDSGTSENFGTFPPFPSIDIHNVNVIVDGETASCGELMTYLLKKQKGATIYGSPTYGIPTWIDDYSFSSIVLQYPELLLDFSDAVKVVEQFQHFKIVPDIFKIPFKEFGMF
jgi:hypothetical protein